MALAKFSLNCLFPAFFFYANAQSLKIREHFAPSIVLTAQWSTGIIQWWLTRIFPLLLFLYSRRILADVFTISFYGGQSQHTTPPCRPVTNLIFFKNADYTRASTVHSSPLKLALPVWPLALFDVEYASGKALNGSSKMPVDRSSGCSGGSGCVGTLPIYSESKAYFQAYFHFSKEPQSWRCVSNW